MKIDRKPPENVPSFETQIATFWFDEEGILNSISKNPTRTVANTRENFELVKKISGNKKVCLLVYLTRSGVPDQETRKFVAKNLPEVYNAMAMISKPGLAKFIMNFLFRLNAPPIPMKTFSDEKEARVWLKQYL